MFDVRSAFSEVVDFRAGSVDLQHHVLLPVVWVVGNHPLAVFAQVRELVQEGTVGHPVEHVDKLVVHEVQVSDVLTN